MTLLHQIEYHKSVPLEVTLIITQEMVEALLLLLKSLLEGEVIVDFILGLLDVEVFLFL